MTSNQASNESVDLRWATVADLPALEALAVVCFPAAGVESGRVTQATLAHGLSSGNSVLVATNGTTLVGFLHCHRLTAGHVSVRAVAVDPGRQQRRIASLLMQRLIEHLKGSGRGAVVPSISAEVSTANEYGMRLLFSHGFVARTIMRGHPVHMPQDRLSMQYRLREDDLDPNVRFSVQVNADAHIDRLLEDEHHAITALAGVPGGGFEFEISRFDRDDLAALESDEVSTGVTFAGTMLAAVTFVLGFSLQEKDFPNPARVLLLVAAVATTMALVIYTNAAGDLARLRSHKLDAHMRTGNVLSEFGGVYPFLISLPITFAWRSSSLAAGLVVALFVAIALSVYERSPFSISSRFVLTRTARALLVLAVTAPVSGVVVTWADGGEPDLRATWIWTSCIVAVHICLSLLFLTSLHGDNSNSGRGRRA